MRSSIIEYSPSTIILLLLLLQHHSRCPLNCQPQPQSPFSLCVHYIYNYYILINVQHLGTASGVVLFCVSIIKDAPLHLNVSHITLRVAPTSAQSSRTILYVRCYTFCCGVYINSLRGNVGKKRYDRKLQHTENVQKYPVSFYM